MELAYKHNWSEARERLLAYWNMEIIDRPCIAVTAPGKTPRRALAPPADFQTKWTDPEYVAQSYDAGHERTYFGGEAIPGTSLMVGYCFGYGAPLHYSEQTVWQEPIIEDWERRPSLDLDEEEWSWRQVQAVVKRCSEVSAGKWMTGFPNIHQPNDHLPLLRGTQSFLMDLIERPEDVKRALRKLLDNWYVVYERLADLSPQQEGSSGWLGLWCPWRKSVTLQSDVSCMMSPAMFEEFVAPELEELTGWLEGATYHLDGPGALQHLDRLLSLKRLHAIQWTPGTGTPGGLYWLDLYQRIQAGGKGVVISVPYEEVETAVQELKPEGLFILTSAPSADAAEALLERAVEITAGR
ncbi:MAG: uroporphyrinogen decarboxylase/cobalamine-independent methonine synthase family protein [Armatimonadota bacterium]